MNDAAGAQAWSFDVGGGVLTDRRTTSGVTKDFTYAYNLDSSLASLTYPSGRIINYAYNAAGRALSAVDTANSINYALNASYEPHGALRSLHNGASIVATYYYNNRLQPCRISAKHSGTAPTNCADATNIGNIVDFSYNFDSDPAAGVQNNGNVGAIANNTTTARSQSFTYDELNRIATAKTQATSGQYCWGETFSYDIWANLKTIGALAGYTGCTQESFSVTQITNKNQLPTSDGYQYDLAGNLTSATGMGSYTWDAESRMKATAGVTYTYDGDGRRVRKSNGKLYWYGASGLDALLETDLAGNTPTEFVFFGGKRIARRDSSGSISYFFADHLGSSRVVTNSSGTVVEDSDFYPFGGERVVVNNDPNQYKFTGKERDSESGLDYFGARYYASSQGRWLSPDDLFNDIEPTDPASWNRYTYVQNNPMNKVDPNGESATVIGAIGGAIVGGAVALWRGDNVLKGAASGFVAGAVAGAVIDTAGAAARVAAALAGGMLGGATGGTVARGLDGKDSSAEQIATDAAIGGAAGAAGAAIGKGVTAIGQRIAGPSAALETLRPGPFAGDSVAATGSRVTAAQRRQVTNIGRQSGCHTCGTATPGTRSGRYVNDHQPSTGLNTGQQQQLYPQCTTCSSRQGAEVVQQNRQWQQQQQQGSAAGAGAGAATGASRRRGPDGN